MINYIVRSLRQISCRIRFRARARLGGTALEPLSWRGPPALPATARRRPEVSVVMIATIELFDRDSKRWTCG